MSEETAGEFVVDDSINSDEPNVEPQVNMTAEYGDDGLVSKLTIHVPVSDEDQSEKKYADPEDAEPEPIDRKSVV